MVTSLAGLRVRGGKGNVEKHAEDNGFLSFNLGPSTKQWYQSPINSRKWDKKIGSFFLLLVLCCLRFFMMAARQPVQTAWKRVENTNDSFPIQALAALLPRLVVSMKTIPSRIEFIEPTLTSLLVNQTMPLDTLYIVLPRKKWILKKDEPIDYKIPRFLEDLVHRDRRVVLLRPQYDFGPIDKMLYALGRESQINSNTTTGSGLTKSSSLIYLDDDVIYDPNVLKNLIQKGIEYPDSVIGFSGCTLRSHFRQVAHRFPRKNYDHHPNIYYRTSGTESLPQDEIVDVVQGFTGVLIRPHYFEWMEFVSLVKNVTRQHDIWKASDFIISGYLESRNIRRRVVLGGTIPNLNKDAAGKDNVGRTMHRQVTQAAYDLQGRLGIWRNYTFIDYISLTSHQKDLIDCEAGHAKYCKKAKLDGRDVTQTLNDFLV